MSVERPFQRAAAVTPSDATTFSPPSRGLYVGGAGDVVIRTARADGVAGDTVTLKAPPVGTFLNICFDRVMAATTATLLIRFW